MLVAPEASGVAHALPVACGCGRASLGLQGGGAAREALRAGGLLVPLTNRKSSDKCMESLAIPKAVANSAGVEVALGAASAAERTRRWDRSRALGSAQPRPGVGVRAAGRAGHGTSVGRECSCWNGCQEQR